MNEISISVRSICPELLNHAAAVALGFKDGYPENFLPKIAQGFGFVRDVWRPTENTGQCSNFIDAALIATTPTITGEDVTWTATPLKRAPGIPENSFEDMSRPAAITRAFVYSKLGDSVSIPVKLLLAQITGPQYAFLLASDGLVEQPILMEQELPIDSCAMNARANRFFSRYGRYQTGYAKVQLTFDEPALTDQDDVAVVEYYPPSNTFTVLETPIIDGRCTLAQAKARIENIRRKDPSTFDGQYFLCRLMMNASRSSSI